MREPVRSARVLLVIPRLTLGGTERQVALLAGGLRRRGMDTRVLVLFSGGAREQDLAEQGVPYETLGLPERPRDLWRAPVAAVRLLRALARPRPDVVHVFLFEAYVLVPPLARLVRVPLVVAGRRALSDYKRGRRWAIWMERCANQFVHLFVANAEAVARDTIDVERVPPRRMSVIPNAVPGSAFDIPAVAPLPTEGQVVVCVANLYAYKGHAILIDALEQLAQRGVRATLVLVGDGPERAVLQARAEAAMTDVVFLGQRADAAAVMAAADVVVLPSLHEGMSNVLMEAMALGKAVVATAVGGSPEVVGADGVLCRPGDASDLAAAVGLLLSDPALRDVLGRRARQRMKQQFSVDLLVARHAELYSAGLAARADGAEAGGD